MPSHRVPSAAAPAASRTARLAAGCLVPCALLLAGGCAAPPDAARDDKAGAYYVTGSNIGRRDREVQRVQAVSGDALRSETSPLGSNIAPPEGYRNAN